MYMQNMALAIRHGLLSEWNGLVGFHDSACISSNRVVIGGAGMPINYWLTNITFL